MEIELVPSPGNDDPALPAAAAALRAAELVDDVRPAGSTAWRRAGLDEALGARDRPGSLEAAKSSSAGYVPPGRSSRGATRA